MLGSLNCGSLKKARGPDATFYAAPAGVHNCTGWTGESRAFLKTGRRAGGKIMQFELSILSAACCQTVSVRLVVVSRLFSKVRL